MPSISRGIQYPLFGREHKNSTIKKIINKRSGKKTCMAFDPKVKRLTGGAQCF